MRVAKPLCPNELLSERTEKMIAFNAHIAKLSRERETLNNIKIIFE